tara:strand:+ start:150 stop:383 length:234 start_codon:yes stop_codon:yes gene_type:complete
MSNSIFFIAMAISVAYLIFKFIEMRFILKENKPIKVLARDTLIVYLSVLLGNFVMQQLTTVKLSSKVTQVFTNDPGF